MDIFNTLVINMDSPRFIIYILLVFSTAILGFTNLSKLSKPYYMTPFFLVVIGVFELLSKYLAHTVGNNLIVYHFLIFVEIGFYGFFYVNIYSGKRGKLVIPVGSVITMLCILNSSFLQGMDKLPSNSILFLSIFVVLLSLEGFLEILQKPEKKALVKQPFFWFNQGNLVFFSLTFFVFGYFNLYQLLPTWMVLLIWFSNLYLYSAYFMSVLLQIRIKENSA